MPHGEGDKCELVDENFVDSDQYPKPIFVHCLDTSCNDLDLHLDADNELSDSDTNEVFGIDNAAYEQVEEPVSKMSTVDSQSHVALQSDSINQRRNSDSDSLDGERVVIGRSSTPSSHSGYMPLEDHAPSHAHAEATVSIHMTNSVRPPSPVRPHNSDVPAQPSNFVPSRRGWNHRFAEICSIMHLFCALFSFTFGLLLLGLPGVQTSYSKVGHGMWSGAIFGITGAIGLKAAHIKTPGSITALLIMSTLTGMCCFIIVFLEVYTLTKIDVFYKKYESRPIAAVTTANVGAINSRHSAEAKLQVPSESLVVLHVLLILTVIVEFTLAVWIFILAATALCCPMAAVRDVSIVYAPNT